MMFRQSNSAFKSPSPASSKKKILSIQELGYELGASAAEQWPFLMQLKKYKGMSHLKYRSATLTSCLSVLRQPAFNDEFESGFMIGFERYAHSCKGKEC
jgi:hypothetical protein